MTTSSAEITALDRAHLAAEAAPEDTHLRARIYEILADQELFVLLDAPAPGQPDAPRPRIFDLDEGAFVLAFDREDRLSDFAAGPADYAALPGRVLAGLLAEQQLGLGLNLGAVSARLLPPDALAWLAEMLQIPVLPADADDSPAAPLPPARAEAVATALRARLENFAGMGRAIYLSLGAQNGLRLTIEAAPPALRAALAHALSEALRFGAPDEAAQAEIAFADPADEGLRAVALALPLPERAAPQTAESPAPKAPGMDPEKPPILRF